MKIKKSDKAPEVAIVADWKYWLENMHSLLDRAPQLENDFTIYQNINYTISYVYKFFEKEEIRAYLKRLVTDKKVRPGKSLSSSVEGLFFKMLETNFSILVENIDNIVFRGCKHRHDEFIMSFNGLSFRYDAYRHDNKGVFNEFMTNIALHLHKNDEDGKVINEAIRGSTSISHAIDKLKTLIKINRIHL